MVKAQGRSKEPRFAEAMARLEEILNLIRDERVDVDDLTTHEAEVAGLIKMCRQKIDATEVQVEEIVSSLAAPQEEPAAPGPPADQANDGELPF